MRFADYPLLAKLTRWGIDLHTGVLFGLANQIALGLVASSLIVLILLGYRMWWQRGRAGAFGRPFPRGAWRQVPPRMRVPLGVGVVALGWFVPLFGVSLLAFLVVDAAVGWIARRRPRLTAAGGRQAP